MAPLRPFARPSKLEPDDRETQGKSGHSAGVHPAGRRYGGQAKMKEAIAEYQKIGQDKLEVTGRQEQPLPCSLLRCDSEVAIKAGADLNPSLPL